jgi:hypothetical protein
MKVKKTMPKSKDVGVVIEVRGGIAYVSRKDVGVALKIIDWDNTESPDLKAEECYTEFDRI